MNRRLRSRFSTAPTRVALATVAALVVTVGLTATLSGKVDRLDPSALPPSGGEVYGPFVPSKTVAARDLPATRQWPPLPPSDSGEAGPDHRVQVIDGLSGAGIAIQDRATGAVFATFDLGRLGSGNCAFGAGDAVVLFDRQADRWLLSQASQISSAVCVYVSQTPDPTGAYFSYEILAPGFPASPRYSVLADDYHVNGADGGRAAAYALERMPMLAGLPATARRLANPGLGTAKLGIPPGAPPGFSKSFSPATIGPGSASVLTFEIDNTASALGVRDLAFSDTLPVGMTIATPSSAATDCSNAVLSAPDGGDTVTFSNGRLGAFSTCSVSLNVVADAIGDATTAHLNISGDLTSSEGNSGPATATLTVDVTLPGFSKSFSPSSIPLGATSTLTLTIDNTLNAAGMDGLFFTDFLPTGMVVASPANAASDCGTPPFVPTVTAVPGTNEVGLNVSGFASFPAVAAGASCTVTVDVTTDSNGVFVNTTRSLTAGPSGSAVPTGVATAKLDVLRESLVKVFVDDPVPPGGSVTLEFTVTNFDRNFPATGIAFDDPIDPLGLLTGLASGETLPKPACGGTLDFAAGTLSLTGGSLPAEGSCTFSVLLDVPLGASAGTYINTTDPLTATVDGVGVILNAATDELRVLPIPILTKEFVGEPVGGGGDVTLRFTVQNTSTTFPATDIAFFDELTTFLPTPIAVSAPTPTPPCGAGSAFSLVFFNSDLDRQALQLTGGNLPSGGACAFDVTLTVPVGFPAGDYLNTTTEITATLDGATISGLPASDTLSVVAAPSLIKEFTNDPVVPGGTVNLQFTLTHNEFAPGDATSITFTDDLAALVSIPGLVATGLPLTDVCGPGNGTLAGLASDTLLTFFGATLAPGQSCAFSVTLDVPAVAAAGSHTNTTSGVSATVDGVTTVEDPASDDLDVASVRLTKEFLDDPVLPGGTVTLRFTIDNTSPVSDATAITFEDILDPIVLPGLTAVVLPGTDPCGAGSALVSFDPPDDTDFSPPAVLVEGLKLTGGNLLAGETCFFDVTLLVPAATVADTYPNRTRFFKASIDGGSLVSFENASDELVVADSFLALTKEFTNDPVLPGGTVNLRFTLTNLDAAQSATGIAFSDDLEAALSDLAATNTPLTNACGVGSQVTGTDSLSFSGGSLGPGASCSFDVTLQVPASVTLGSVATNTTSEVTATIGGLPVTGDPAIDDLTINTLGFSKTFEAPSGCTTVLSFTIVNADTTASADELSFTDNLADVIPGLVATGLPAMNVCGPGSVLEGTSLLTLVGGNLPPGGSCTIDVTLQLPPSTTVGRFPNVTSSLRQAGVPATLPATATLEIVEPLGAEVCNGLDDDCDGLTDNAPTDAGGACSAGVGECSTDGVEVCNASGVLECDAIPGMSSPEVCDGLDNDCDGSTDNAPTDTGGACSAGVGECSTDGVEVCNASGVLECDAIPSVSSPEVCDGLDNDCDGSTDNAPTDTGGACSAGVGECSTDGVEVCNASGVLECDAIPSVSSPEVCDGLDNDCDGSTDNAPTDTGGACSAGVGECSTDGVEVCNASGVLECDAIPSVSSPEVCDGLDNDCDGSTDNAPTDTGGACSAGVGECSTDGVEVCNASGVLECDAIPSVSSPEVCDGLDNDCDGSTDNAPTDTGGACSAGVGECSTDGVEVCNASGVLECDAIPSVSSPEVCDGLDNDCDGTTDEGFDVGTTCEGEGACGAGLFECDGSGGAVCSTDPGGSGFGGTLETCDGLDNDCDGDTDEDSVGTALTQPTTCGVGECAGNGGFETCSGGLFGGDTCNPLSGAVVETCDGLDNDCDGTTDEACMALQMESGTVTAGGSHSTVNLLNAYVDPIVVATVQYAGNTRPVVTRVSNVTSTSFDLRLQNPSGGVPSSDTVSYWVVERGVWTVDGVKLEADRYVSTQTSRKGGWSAVDPRPYGQVYVRPVVVGQVMSENDPRWSVFFAHGARRTDPPSASTLNTGKHVGEDVAHQRANETIGYIVVEALHTNLAGVEFEAADGLDTILGVQNGPPFTYTFNNPFGTAPTVVVASSAGMDGADGGWAQVHGPTKATTTRLYLSIDEDQIGDTERSHTSEQVTYAAFSGPMIFPVPPMCTFDADCDDGAFCNGAELCDANRVCRPGDDPCPGQLCDEAGDTCIAGVTPKMESVTAVAGGRAPATVSLTNNYASPVIACTVVYNNNTVPVVARIDTVTSNSFEVYLQNPGDLAPAVNDQVKCLVVEEGSWMMDGHPVEAVKYESTITDKEYNWLGAFQTLSHSFSNPVVLGQVMSSNDPLFSYYWQQGTARNQPPSGLALRNGKTVAEDPNVVRLNETMGYIVFEQSNGTLGGVTFEAALGPDTVKGIDNGPPQTYAFNVPFATAPTEVIATQAGMDGSDGSWAYLYGPTFTTATQLSLAVDEDQIFNAERSHTTEQVGYVAFATPVVFPSGPCTSDSQCDDGLFCNGAETCNVGPGTCSPGTPVTCGDGVGCTVDSCNELTDSCDNAPDDGLCDNGQFCDGAETCSAILDCQAGTDPCGGGACDEVADVCPGMGPVAQMEWGRVNGVGGSATTVNLSNGYQDPVVVTSLQYSNNTLPVVTRVTGVTGNSFQVFLQNPSGQAVAAETVSYIVVEKGTWVMGGVKIEAQKYTSTKTAHDTDWNQFDARAYGQGYTSPIVLGQVMSTNDARFSSFWSRGSGRGAPPSATVLNTGKTVAEDPITARANETIGFIVIERGHRFLGGVEFEAGLSTDSVAGVVQSPPYPATFTTSFPTPPTVAVAVQEAMDGFNGGWMYTFGAPTATVINLAGDEDQLSDAERGRATEQAGFVVFQSPGVFP